MKVPPKAHALKAQSAPDSIHVQKKRRSLEKSMHFEASQIKPDSLKDCAKRIIQRLERLSPERQQDVKNRSQQDFKKRKIVIFDENKHPARIKSKEIKNLMKKIEMK